MPNNTKLEELKRELYDMTDVLLGRKDPPVNVGISTMMEVAEAYHARASEIEMLIHAGELEGSITKGSPAYKFRTGMLRTFTEMCKRTIDLGSRRITASQMEITMREQG